MKRLFNRGKLLPLMMIAFAMLAASLAGGFSMRFLAAAKIETTDGVRYNYLVNPRALGANGSYIFLLDADDLVVINRGTGRTVGRIETNVTSFPAGAAHVHFEKDLLFVFWTGPSSTYFRAYAVDSADPEKVVLNQIGGFFGLTAGSSAFTVAYVDDYYRVYTAKGNTYSYQLFLYNGFTLSSGGIVSGTPIAAGQSINSLSYNKTDGRLYFTARTGDPFYFSIFQEGRTASLYDDFTDLISFNALGGSFAFIADYAGPKLMLFTPPAAPTHVVTDDLDDVIRLKKSKRPSYMYALSDTEIFTIDSRKKSIDQYKILNGHLDYSTTVCAYFGDDNGYYNNPKAVCVIDSARYIVADRTGVRLITDNKVTSFASAGTSERELGTVLSAAFDMHERVYIASTQNTVITVKVFGLNDGTVRTISDTRFKSIVQLAAAPDQRIYVLDSVSGILRINLDGTVTALNVPVTVTAQTRATVAETKMFMINPNVTIDLDAPAAAAAPRSTPSNALDIAVDALGNPVVLSGVSGAYFINYMIPAAAPAAGFVNDAQSLGSNAAVGPIASLSLDRLTGKAFWLGASEMHCVMSHQITDYWSPAAANINPGGSWQNGNPLLRTAAADGLFMQNKRAAVIYQFPNAVGAVKKYLTATKQFKVVDRAPVISLGSGTDPFTPAYAYVMYEEPNKTTVFGYIAHALIETAPEGTYAKKGADLGFRPTNTSLSGRVIVNGAPIYKYPTSFFANDLIVSTKVKKNFGLTINGEGLGLVINRKVTLPDFTGLEFYEILITKSGDPMRKNDTAGRDWVGYINVRHVIDAHEGPSILALGTNARIQLANTDILIVYENSDGSIPTGDELKNGTRLYLNEKFDKKKPFTFVFFIDDFGTAGEGWVETRFVVPDGITTWQIIGIAALGAAVVAAAAIIIWSIKARRKNSPRPAKNHRD